MHTRRGAFVRYPRMKVMIAGEQHKYSGPSMVAQAPEFVNFVMVITALDQGRYKVQHDVPTLEASMTAFIDHTYTRVEIERRIAEERYLPRSWDEPMLGDYHLPFDEIKARVDAAKWGWYLH